MKVEHNRSVGAQRPPPGNCFCFAKVFDHSSRFIVQGRRESRENISLRIFLDGWRAFNRYRLRDLDSSWRTLRAAIRASHDLWQWTRRYHWPLVLSTSIRGVLTVRVSTDNDNPMGLERIIPGEVVPLFDSPAGALFHAYSPLANTAQREQFDWHPQSRPGNFNEELIREMGFASSPAFRHTSARVSVPLLLEDQFIGCLTMRCLSESIHEDADCNMWVARLKSLAADIASESGEWLGECFKETS